LEAAGDGIRVNAVAPGTVATERVTALRTPEQTRRIAETVPLGRIGEPEEIAEVVLFLASDAARYVTGASLDVNGGLVMLYPSGRLQEPRLAKRGGVVPVDPLTRQFVAAKLHDHHDVDADLPTGRRHVRQKPRHRPVVSERETELVHELSVTDDSVDGRHLQIGRP